MSAVFFTLMLTLSVSALTGKIGNARAVLYPEVGFWGVSIDRTVYVENVNNEPVNITLSAGESKILEIIDKSFILEPGESKDAKFIIKLKKPGNYTEKLNIFFTPLDGNSAGVVLSATYTIYAKDKGSSDSSDNSDSSDSIDDSSNSDSGVSGNVIKMQNFVSDNKAVVAVSASTLVLAVLLIILVYFSKKRRGKLKTKRSEKNR